MEHHFRCVKHTVTASLEVNDRFVLSITLKYLFRMTKHFGWDSNYGHWEPRVQRRL